MKTKLLLLATLFTACFSAPAQDWAKAALEKSPRHGEWVDVTNGTRVVHCFVVYPEVKDPAPVVLVIHEIFGLTDWARSAADKIAEAGYIAIAPDLLSGEGPNGGGTASFGGDDAARNAVPKLSATQVTGDLNAAADYAIKLPAANGKLAVAGFCWGGAQSFRFATTRKDLKAAFVFYGTPSATNEMAAIQCPVYGFYAGNDARVSATVPGTLRSMKTLHKTYEPMVYDGAGHGFMREGEKPGANAKNLTAHDSAWRRFKEYLKKL